MTSLNRDRVVTDFRKVKDLSAKTLTFSQRGKWFGNKVCKSIHFSKDVSDFLVKVLILVWRSVIFEKNMLILLRRCDSDVAKP